MTPIYTLSASERLKSRKLIAKIFAEGKSQFHFPFKLMYLLEVSSDSSSPLKFSISVPRKKIKSAPVRNRVKRRSREAYRLNKLKLQENLKGTSVKLSLMFIYLDSEAKNYSVIEKSIKYHLRELQIKISEYRRDLPS